VHHHDQAHDQRKQDAVLQNRPVVAEDCDIDSPAVSRDLPPLICDADSSQRSGLVDVFRGKNVIIQGPPGTGKSQTITNLIAAALAKGQTVLFVSEKLAAPEVVRRKEGTCPRCWTFSPELPSRSLGQAHARPKATRSAFSIARISSSETVPMYRPSRDWSRERT